MKKVITLLLCVCFIVPCAFMFSGCKEQATPPDYWDGSRVAVPTADNKGVVQIATAEQLAGLAKSVNEGNDYEGITIELTNNLDLLNIEWTPISYGSYNNNTNTINCGAVFKGTFDGKNHTIYNLKVTRFREGGVDGGAVGVGLFGNNLGTIKNLIVEGAEVSGNHYVAVIAGFNAGSTIENCHVRNAKVSCFYFNSEESGDKAGTIAGYVGNRGVISSLKNCSAMNSTVNASRDAGQIVGCIKKLCQENVIDNSASNVIVSDNDSIKDAEYMDYIANDLIGKIA